MNQKKSKAFRREIRKIKLANPELDENELEKRIKRIYNQIPKDKRAKRKEPMETHQHELDRVAAESANFVLDLLETYIKDQNPSPEDMLEHMKTIREGIKSPEEYGKS